MFRDVSGGEGELRKGEDWGCEKSGGAGGSENHWKEEGAGGEESAEKVSCVHTVIIFWSFSRTRYFLSTTWTEFFW